MSVIRTQFLRHTTATLINAAETVVDIFGPETASEPPYAENTDHVTRPRQVRENEAGVAQVGLPANFLAANVFLRKVEIWDKKSLPGQRGLDPALFPSGATPGGSDRKRVVFDSEAADLIDLTDDGMLSILGGSPLDADPDKHTPLLTVGADEFIKLTFFNNSGGDIGPEVIQTKFDLGLNPAVGGSQP